MASVWDTEFDYRFKADYGNQYDYDYSDPTNYRSSYGGALQWVSPLGPLVFLFAKPIKSMRVMTKNSSPSPLEEPSRRRTYFENMIKAASLGLIILSTSMMANAAEAAQKIGYINTAHVF